MSRYMVLKNGALVKTDGKATFYTSLEAATGAGGLGVMPDDEVLILKVTKKCSVKVEVSFVDDTV